VSDVAQLVPKPTIRDEIREDIIATLRRTLAEAEAGEIIGLFMIKKGPSGHWSDSRSGVTEFSDFIGKIEIVKQDWIEHYRRDNMK
jgi:hypothetical protein